jgi:hypothetical protein
MNEVADAILFKFKNLKENFKIFNPSADAWKVPSYTAESTKLHFIS